jgi:hypothetical protein
MAERVSFNINAELYENQFGELAVRFPGEKVYRDVGEGKEASFIDDARAVIVDHRCPQGWHEMPAHELLYGKGWQCISRLGFIGGDTDKPGVEFEVDAEEIGKKARKYLGEVLH